MMYITCIRNKEVFSIFRWLLFLAKDHLRAKPFFLNVVIGRAALGSGSLQTIFVSYIPAAVAMAVANLGRGLILSFNLFLNQHCQAYSVFYPHLLPAIYPK